MAAPVNVVANGMTRRALSGADGHVTVDDGAPMTVVPAGPGTWRVTTDGVSRRLWVTGPRDAPWIYFDGRVYRPAEVRSGSAARPGARDDASALSAPMPATVREVRVKAGDRVEAGATLVVLEAMKMELIVRAPAEGTVRAVFCEQGELVQPGAPLVDLS